MWNGWVQLRSCEHKGKGGMHSAPSFYICVDWMRGTAKNQSHSGVYVSNNGVPEFTLAYPWWSGVWRLTGWLSVINSCLKWEYCNFKGYNLFQQRKRKEEGVKKLRFSANYLTPYCNRLSWYKYMAQSKPMQKLQDTDLKVRGASRLSL